MRFWPLVPRQPLTGVTMSAMLGIVIADWWAAPLWAICILCALAGIALALRPRTSTCWLFAVIVFFTLHTLREHHSPAAALARELADENRVVRATGIVWSEPTAPRSGPARFRLKVDTIQIDGTERVTDLGVNANWLGETPTYGDRVEITGSAKNIGARRNPGEFDLAAYLRREGIYSEIRTRYASDCRILGHGYGNGAQRFAFVARHWVQTQLELDLKDAPQIAGLIGSMVLGLKSETPLEVKELFQRTGTLHLFAVSGLNVAMLGALVWLILKPLRIRRTAAVFITIPVLCAYALITGLSASCVRATIMGTVILLAYVVDRRPVLYNSLSAAAFAILAWDTNQLFSPGFQFSFALVFTLAFLAQRIQRRVEPLGVPDPFLPRALWSWRHKLSAQGSHAFAAALGVTLAAWGGSLLFTIGYFHLFSLAAILANLVAVPLAFGVLTLGLFSVVMSPVATWAAILSNNANWLCARLLLRSVELCALIPGGNLYVETPDLSRAPDCEVVVFDLGSGAAAHLRSGGRDWLIDCGSSARYEQTILPYLRTRGVNRLDALLLTHGDAQHIGGALGALDDFQPQKIIDSAVLDRSSTRRAFHVELGRRNLGKNFARPGEVFGISSTTRVCVLYPPAGHQRAVADDKALVLRLECGGVRALFMSDGGFSTEQWLLQNQPDLRADVLVKGQHSKDLSGTLDFVSRVQPRLIVCNGAPFAAAAGSLDEWERKMVAAGIMVYRQDRTGAVRIAIGRGDFVATTFVNDQTFRSRAR